MIHRFRVINFQSIRDEVELDFRVAGTAPALECLPESQSRDDVRLPAVVALVGPNGAGKTTLLKALFHALYFAHASYGNPEAQNVAVFAPSLAPSGISAPTRVEVELEARLPIPGAGGPCHTFRYTIEIGRDNPSPVKAFVAYEALHYFPSGRPRRLLERRNGEPLYVARETQVRPKDDRLTAISNLPRTSALSALGAMGAGLFPSFKAELEKIGSIFHDAPINGLDQKLANVYSADSQLVTKITESLSRFDLGINAMDVLSLKDGSPVLTFSHRGLSSPVIMQSESSGTKQLVRAFPLIESALSQGKPLIFDGLDSDLHADLALEIINRFRRKETNPHKAQLICSLHNMAILEDLEKEEVVIVDKSRNGVTDAYFATEISGLRRGGSLLRQYRNGVMGGLPVIG